MSSKHFQEFKALVVPNFTDITRDYLNPRTTKKG